MTWKLSQKECVLLGVSLILPQLAGALGTIFTREAIPTWYAMLVRPEIAPPNWIFGSVWTSLYLLMGIALFIVWRKGIAAKGVRTALVLFGIQLVLNALWSAIFFGMQNLGLALIELCLLWLAIVATSIAFARVSKKAALLLAPYLLWVSFAAYLNFQFWMLN